MGVSSQANLLACCNLFCLILCDPCAIQALIKFSASNSQFRKFRTLFQERLHCNSTHKWLNKRGPSVHYNFRDSCIVLSAEVARKF